VFFKKRERERVDKRRYVENLWFDFSFNLKALFN